MKRNIQNLFLMAILAGLSATAHADKYVKMPKCEPLKPKLEMIKESFDESNDWELKLDSAKEKRTKLNSACADYQADPTEPKLREFQKCRDEYIQASNFLKEKTTIVKKKLADSKKGLEFLKDKTTCKEDLKTGENKVKEEYDNEVLASGSTCRPSTAAQR